MKPPADRTRDATPTVQVEPEQFEPEAASATPEVHLGRPPVWEGDRTRSQGSAARRHSEVMMLTAAERRDKAASILADGVLRVLARDLVIEPATDDAPQQGNHDDRADPPVIFRLPAQPPEAK